MTVLESKIDEEGKKCSASHEFCVGHSRLNYFPMKLFSFSGVEMLRRLDISYNNISILPAEIGTLHNLQSLWISNNPIQFLPGEVSSLVKLKELDLRNTLISKVPLVIAVLNLHELDWRDTPMAIDFKTKYDITPGDLHSLKGLLKNIHEREEIEKEFIDLLRNVRFVKESDFVPNFDNLVEAAVRTISDMFSSLVDFRMFLRRADNFLPKLFSQFTVDALLQCKEAFINFQRDSQRKCLAADLEIKIRGIFFDRIERNGVMTMIDSIYLNVESLENIQFLLKYASAVLPQSPDNDNCGLLVYSNILKLQEELTGKRQAAIKSVCQAMAQLYPEQPESAILERAAAVCAVFQNERFATKRELNSLSQLAADSVKYFPSDFMSVNPAEVATQAKLLNSRSR